MSVLITGSRGMLGKALMKLIPDAIECDLSLGHDLREYFVIFDGIDTVIHCAAKVGGIMDNMNNQESYLTDNALMAINVINECVKHDVRLINIASSCIYPRNCPQPMKTEYLLSGEFEPTNEGYALGKMIGVKLCEYYIKKGYEFITLIPPNLYGESDNFSESGHVIAALIRKFHEQEVPEIWGDGSARREFMYVDDLAQIIETEATYEVVKPGIFNVGVGVDYSIKEIVEMLKKISGKNKVIWDKSKPNGMARKFLEPDMHLNKSTQLYEGLRRVYESYSMGR